MGTLTIVGGIPRGHEAKIHRAFHPSLQDLLKLIFVFISTAISSGILTGEYLLPALLLLDYFIVL